MNKFLIGLPLSILLIFTIISTGSAAGGFTPSGTEVVCVAGSPNCAASGSGTTYTCGINLLNGGTLIGAPCQMPGGSGYCPTNIAQLSPTYCYTNPLGTQFWLLPYGDSITLVITGANQVQGGVTGVVMGAIYGLGGANGSGFWIAIAIALVVVTIISGLTILGTGLSPEAIRTIFMAGGLVGIWLILSAAEGFIFGVQNEPFSLINGVFAYAGTGLYAMLTMLYVFGIFDSLKYGGGA